MSYIDKGDTMANSYSISPRTEKWSKHITFSPHEPNYTEYL